MLFRSAYTEKSKELLSNFSHQSIIENVEKYMEECGGKEFMLQNFQKGLKENYDILAKYYFSATEPNDPRYYYFMRSQLIFENQAFSTLWDAIFSANESEFRDFYEQVLIKFLDVWSKGAPEKQSFLVTGHIKVENGYKIISNRQLRIASYAHSIPHESGKYMLLDFEKPIKSMNELVENLHTIQI